jgi:PAS domain S-box-containing protein
MPSDPQRALSQSWWWVAAGVVANALVVVVDLATDHTVVMGALILGPFVAALGARPLQVAGLGVLSAALAIALGPANDIFGETDHVVRVLIVVGGCIGATLLAYVRQARERDLERAEPAALDALRMAFALEAGEMGTWRWDLETGRVEWDARLEAHYGLEPGAFDGRFETYTSLLHDDDRDRVLAVVRDGMEHGTSWRFDHRVVWPDGSEHWLEGRGEPVRDASGTITGGTGVSINVDARYRAAAERALLLEAERRARKESERSTRALQQLSELTLALAGAATTDQVAVTIVHHGIQALDADTGWFGSLDHSTGHIITRAHEGYVDETIARYLAIPADDTTTPAAEALASGTAIYIETPEARVARYPQLQPVEAQGAFAVIPVAILDDAPGVLAFGFHENRAFSEDDRRYVAAVVEACTQALRRASLLEAEQESRARLRTVLDFSEQLAALDDPNAVIRTTARFAATRLGRYAIAYATQPDGTLRRAAVVHADTTRQGILADLAAREIDVHETIAKVAETGIGVYFSVSAEGVIGRRDGSSLDDEARALLEQLKPVSGLVVAMKVSGRTHGVVVIGDDRPVPLGVADLELAADLGRRAASALERAQLWQLSQLQLAAEQHMVDVLQESIVPERLPTIPGIDIAAVYRPADTIVDVGGDWYDAFSLEGCPLVLVVGDVAGHGIDAASLMGRVRNGLRAYAVDEPDPAQLLRRVHGLLRALDPDSMVTAVVASYDPGTRVLTWARAGHPPPLLCDRHGRTRFLEDVNATPLGTLGKNFSSARVELDEGALVVLYTDGLIERRDHLIDDGLAWLAERTRALCTESADAICRSLVEHSFASTPSTDDICVLVMRVTASEPGT